MNNITKTLALLTLTASLACTASAGLGDFFKAAAGALDDVSNTLGERYGNPVALAASFFQEGQCEQQSDGALICDSRKYANATALVRTVLDFSKPGWRNQDSAARLLAEVEMANLMTQPVGNSVSIRVGNRSLYVYRGPNGETIVTIRNP